MIKEVTQDVRYSPMFMLSNQGILDKGLDWFIEQLEDIPVDIKRYAYHMLLTQYFLSTRVGKFSYEETLILADTLHNLPVFLARNMEGFSDDYFWKYSVWHKEPFKKVREWLQITFVKGIREGIVYLQP